MTARAGVARRVEVVFQQLFGVGRDAFDDQTRRGELEPWDSLGHLALIAALRDEFGIEIPPEQALDMETIADVKRITSALLVAPPRGRSQPR